MSTVFLREIVAKGFCGRRVREDDSRGMGYLATVLDKLFLNGIGTLGTEDGRLQTALKYGIPYKDRVIFDRCCKGIYDSFNDRRPDANQHDVAIGDLTVRFVRLTHSSLGLIEPVYDYYSMENFLPVHSLVGEVLFHESAPRIPEATKILSVWVNENREMVQPYAVMAGTLKGMVVGALNPNHVLAGPQCLSCPLEYCKHYGGGFEVAVREWLKAKQAAEEAEAKVRNHLTYEGPTKSGTHLFYMDEHERRFFNDNAMKEFLAKIIQLDPIGYSQYLRPDSTEIFKAIREGRLSEEITRFFKVSRYWTIESRFSL